MEIEQRSSCYFPRNEPGPRRPDKLSSLFSTGKSSHSTSESAKHSSLYPDLSNFDNDHYSSGAAQPAAPKPTGIYPRVNGKPNTGLHLSNGLHHTGGLHHSISQPHSSSEAGSSQVGVTGAGVGVGASPQTGRLKCSVGPILPTMRICERVCSTPDKLKLRSRDVPTEGGCASNGPVESISPSTLVDMMHSQQEYMILDCRPFTSYNQSHINGAFNVSCSDCINRKRLQQGKLKISDLITPETGKLCFKRPNFKTIVVYDDTSFNGQLSITLKIVVCRLQVEGKQPVVLKGGLHEFKAKYQTGELVVSVDRPLPVHSLPDQPATPSHVEDAPLSFILPFLLIGNERDAQDRNLLGSHGVTHIMNVSNDIPNYFESSGRPLVYKRIAANDSAKQNLRHQFEEAVGFIEEAYKEGGKVLVHCLAGVSRSPTVVIAYIMKRTTLSMNEAYTYVKKRRPVISPNFNFIGQLCEFEQELNSAKVARRLSPPLLLEQTQEHIV